MSSLSNESTIIDCSSNLFVNANLKFEQLLCDLINNYPITIFLGGFEQFPLDQVISINSNGFFWIFLNSCNFENI